MQKRCLYAAIALGLLLVCSLVVFRIVGVHVPTSQAISTEDNLCLGFKGNIGSAEVVLMFTHRCGFPITQKDALGPYDEGTYLDMVVTMECPQIKLADKDRDGLKEIYVIQNQLCKQFAHPWKRDPKKLVYRISRTGQFLEIESK